MSIEQQLEWLLEDAKVVRIEPGQVLALVIKDEITSDQAEKLRELAKPYLGDVVVLSGGIEVAVTER